MSIIKVALSHFCCVYSDLETRVSGHTRSSKIIPFNPAPMISY